MPSRLLTYGINNTENNFGVLLGFLVILYALLSNLNMWFTGDSGLFRAHHLFFIAFLLNLLILSDFGRVALRQLSYSPISGPLILFLLWMVVAWFRVILFTNASYSPILIEIIYGITLGFVVGCGYRIKLFLGQRFRDSLSLKYLVIILTLAFWLVPYYYLTKYSYAFRQDIHGFTDMYIRNYQQIADFFGIALIVIIGVQSAWFIRHTRGVTGLAAFFILQLVQIVSAAYVLQAFFSNKGPLLAALVSLSAILVVLKKLIGNPSKRLWIIIVLTIASVAAFELLTFISENYLDTNVIKKSRLTSYGEAEGFSDFFSSVESRWFISDSPDDNYINNVFIGNPSHGLEKGDFLHSLLSVQVNLGVVGSILIMLIIVRGYLLTRKHESDLSTQMLITRISFYPIIFVISIGGFFSWIVFWFLIGGLLAMNTRKARISNHYET